MLLHLKNLLTQDEVRSARSLLGAQAPWLDGRSSAGELAVQQKNNQQLAQDSDHARQLQAMVLAAIARDALLFSAALPRKIFNPLFNCYSGASNHYGVHIDSAVMHSRNPQQRVRSDISCTLFLSDPADYEGGELIIQEPDGDRRIKLPAGDLILYPGTTLHQVAPVTRGTRIASFFWIESMVRSGEQRRLLFDMDMALLQLRRDRPEDPATVKLTGTYHNLLRMWADT
jgi:PKHD-type hydroxylase